MKSYFIHPILHILLIYLSTDVNLSTYLVFGPCIFFSTIYFSTSSSIYLTFCLSVHLFIERIIYLSIDLSVWLSCFSVCPSLHRSFLLSMDLQSICLSPFLPIYLVVCPFTDSLIFPSAYLSIDESPQGWLLVAMMGKRCKITQTLQIFSLVFSKCVVSNSWDACERHRLRETRSRVKCHASLRAITIYMSLCRNGTWLKRTERCSSEGTCIKAKKGSNAQRLYERTGTIIAVVLLSSLTCCFAVVRF